MHKKSLMYRLIKAQFRSTRPCRAIAQSSILQRRTRSSLPKFDFSRRFEITEPPCPDWELGQGIPSDSPFSKEWNEDEKKGWKTWNTEAATRDIYKVLTSTVIPRPIAFVSTISSDGIPNLAPMSYFSLVAHNPPLLSVSFSLSKGKPKDSRENILATKEFTVSIISEPFVEAANATSVDAPPEIDEWLLAGLTPEPSTSVKPGRVKESAVGLECELYQSIDIKAPGSDDEVTHTLVLGLIKQIHVRNAVLTADGSAADPAKLRAVARLGGSTYAQVLGGFDLPRPSWTTRRHAKTDSAGKP